MAKISIKPWPSKIDENGEVPLVLVIYAHSKRATLFTDVRLKPRHWNENTGEVRKTLRDHHHLNTYLKNLSEKARTARSRLLAENGYCTAHEIRDALKRGPGDSDFIELFRKRIDEFAAEKRWGSKDAYEPVLVKIRAFTRKHLGKDTLDIRELNVKWLQGFESFLISEYGNSRNTVTKNLGYIRTVMLRAISAGLLPRDSYPFATFKLKTKRGRRHKKIPIEKIWEMEDLELTGRREDVRDLFVFCFYASGCRISDGLRMSGKDIVEVDGSYRIEYEARKTGEESFSSKLFGPAEAILRKHGWPKRGYIFSLLKNLPAGSEAAWKDLKSKEALVNKYLAEIAVLIDVDVKLTSHVARHSWSFNLVRHDIDVEKIRESLDHSDLRTTQTYTQSMRAGAYDEELEKAISRP